MKAAILANNQDTFVKPLAHSLKFMLSQLSVDSKIFYNGHKWLTNPDIFSYTNSIKKKIKETYCRFILSEQLKGYDFIVLVMNMPVSFMKNYIQNLSIIRKALEVPILNYDLHYLGSRGPWIDWILNGNPKHNIAPNSGYGLERFDYYLMLSVVNEFPMPKTPHPCSVIGVNLDDGSLYPEQNSDYIALVDFERKNFMPERQIQIEALEETNTEYFVLDRHYPMDEIRSIYRKSAMYFLAHRESFGLPICELQACGCYIFTPYAHWAGSHFIKDVYEAGEGQLTENFIVYNNDKEMLKRAIEKVKRDYKPRRVIANFQKNYPHYWRGDLKALSEVIKKIENGEINNSLHASYKPLNDTIVRKNE
jgi:hypothetical protein